MQAKSIASSTTKQSPLAASAPSPIPINQGTIVLSGYGVSIVVDGGMLRCRDGLFGQREGRFDKASGLCRLVVLGHSGTVSFKALRWLSDIHAPFVQLDSDGEVIAASGVRGTDDARLRRAQSIAPYTDTGLEVTRLLLHQKLYGQARVARSLNGTEAADRIMVDAETLDAAFTFEDLRGIEAHAAAIYWQLWENLSVKFARKDAKRVPPRWQTFGMRASPLSGAARRAATPANAMLNYLYAILEAEARIALQAVGLDPGLGILHTDTPARDSLACDVMEVVRPEVDTWLLSLLRERTFAKDDFGELPDGRIRITIDLARQLSETALSWRMLVGPVAEQVARQLADGHKVGIRLPTKLSQSNRSAGRREVAAKKTTGDKTHRVAVAVTAPRLMLSCPSCGKPQSGQNRTYCEGCLPEYRAEQVANFLSSGPSALATRRANGDDPAHGGESGRKKGRTNARKATERQEWERTHPNADLDAERTRFTREVLPRLASVPLAAIQEAMSCSPRYASLTRKGEVTPHPMHYDALGVLAFVGQNV